MGFRTPQFDFIDQRFSHKHMKTLEVSCSRNVQATLARPEQIAAGSAVLSIINLATGELLPGVRIVVTDIDVGAAVIPNKICNVFIVTWQIVDEMNTVLVTRTNTIVDTVDCPGAGVGPSQTVVQKHDIQLNFCFLPVDTDNSGFPDLLFANIEVTYCLVAANESIFKINAVRPFCP